MTQRSKKIFWRDTLRPVYAFLLAAMAGGAGADIPWPKDPTAVLGYAITASAVVIGFLLSAQAILLSSTGEGIDRVKKMGLFIELADAFAIATFMAAGFLLVNFSGNFFGVESRLFESVWLGFGAGTLYGFTKTSQILFTVIRQR